MDKPLDVGTHVGLSEQQVAQRLQTDGYNELPSTKKRSVLLIAWDVIREPMFLLLLGCGAVYLLLGEPQEAFMLLGFVFVVMGITLYQERKTERALEALRDLSSPRALVIRDGQRKRIAGREVVKDDLVILSEGDRIPADSLLLSCSNLTVDESLLTGESVPVRKTPSNDHQEKIRPGGDDLPFVFSGTLVVQGQGMAQVQATGSRTEIGKIGKALQHMQTEGTLLQAEISQLVRYFALFGLCLCALVIVMYGLTRHDWLNGLLAGITLAMAMLPEEFPVVLTIFLALGAWRLSKRQVLTRRVAAIETLGAATVLCVDKTGTLTENQMSIRKLNVADSTYDLNANPQAKLPEEFHWIVEYGILASQRDPFDPMEKAFHQLGKLQLSDTDHLHADWTQMREFPLSPSLLALSHVWKSPSGDEFVVAAKGAPEAIADLCHMEDERIRRMTQNVSTMAQEGLRVLGIARGLTRPKDLPVNQHDFTFEFLGLVGLADPVRLTVPAAVRECITAGIRVVMITGDHPTTAQSIARQVGLSPSDQVITGTELEAMDDEQLQKRIGKVSIFARMVPEQKLRLVNALKADGEIVAMTADGVNDAPALKSAHIGIAMGGRGTDVAREAASLVLLDDDFSSIVQAVRMGRRVYDHLQKAMTYILAIHVPIAGLSLLPVLFRWPLILMPVHILFLELIIDPASSIVFEAEPEESDLMQHPPRSPEARLFNPKTLSLGLLQGASVLLIVLATYLIAQYQGRDEHAARTLCFTTLILANLGLILVNRSWSRPILGTLRTPNPALWWIFGGTLCFLGLALSVPILRNIFHFSVLSLADFFLCLGCAVLSILWFEVVKTWRKWQTPSGSLQIYRMQ